jgi:dimethylargininase
MLHALTRLPSPALPDCELTHIDRVPIDLARAEAQHAAYCAALREAGAEVRVLPALGDYPDSCFVEDTALILPELVVRTRPGALSRQGEVALIAPELPADRPHATIMAPGTLDGGDVLVVETDIFIGLTARSNAEGVRQLAEAAGRFGYRTTGIPLAGALHLKTAASALPDGRVLVNSDWLDPAIFGRPWLASAPGEPFAANSLTIADTLFHAAGGATAALLAKAGFAVVELDISEFAKAEAGLTCLSLVYGDR